MARVVGNQGGQTGSSLEWGEGECGGEGREYRVSTGNLKLSTQGPSYCIQSSGTENTKLNCFRARNVTLPRKNSLTISNLLFVRYKIVFDCKLI